MEMKRKRVSVERDGRPGVLLAVGRRVGRQRGESALGRVRWRLSAGQLALADVERQVGLVDLARLFAEVEAEAADQGRW